VGSIAGSAATTSSEEDTNAKLRKRIPAYSLQAEDFGHALILFAEKHHLPMAVEWIRSPNALRKIELSWHDATVQQMLQTLVKNQGGYRLDFNNEIIHVFAMSVRTSDRNFLNLKVARFSVRNEVVELVSRRLRNWVRLQAPGAGSAPERGVGIISSQGVRPGDPALTFLLENTTVRQILDRLITDSDRRIWVVTFVEDDRPTPNSDLRTATLWTQAHVPDAEQPVWDLIRWSDTIP
jgi:hypothetical protein